MILDTAAPGHSLTDLGREQSDQLAELLGAEEIGAIIVSDLVRTQQTAAPLAARLGLEPVIHADGREIFAGDLEDATYDEAFEEYAHTAFGWVDGDRDTRLANGESGAEVLARFDRQVRRAADAASAADKPVGVIVAHGAVLRVWAAGADASFIASHPLPNTAIIELEGNPDDGWRMVSYAGLAPGQIADDIDDSRAPDVARDERQTAFGG